MPFARTDRLRGELRRALPDRPFAVSFWDGTVLEATEAGAPTFKINSPQALAHVLRAPGELGLGRAYVSGLIETDDLDSALLVVDHFEPPALDLRTKLRLAGALVRATGLLAPPRVPAAASRSLHQPGGHVASASAARNRRPIPAGPRRGRTPAPIGRFLSTAGPPLPSTSASEDHPAEFVSSSSGS